MRNFARGLIQLLDSKPKAAKGQSLIELALTAPILILMVIGTAEIGFMANNYLIALDAVREGGRYAAVGTPLTWAKDPTQASGDPETRNQQRADCETTFTDGTSTKYHINSAARDTQFGFTGGTNPHPVLPGYTSGNETTALGFFDGTACQVVAALDPLMFNYNTDDVVVSVIAFARQCAQWSSNAASCYDANRQPLAGSTQKLVVTGRWPLSNRKCPDDERDPFANPAAASPFIPAPGAGSSDVRGYIMTGNAKVKNGSGSTVCTGSKFYVSDSDTTSEYNIEARLNSLQTGAWDPFKNYAPGGALVLVELYFNHNQLFNFPPFNLFNDPDTKGILFHVWMMFPVNAAEPTPTPGV